MNEIDARQVDLLKRFKKEHAKHKIKKLWEQLNALKEREKNIKENIEHREFMGRSTHRLNKELYKIRVKREEINKEQINLARRAYNA